MANTINFDSTGSILIDLAVKLPSSKLVALSDLGVLFDKGEFFETTEGISSASFYLRSQTKDFVDTVLRTSGSEGTPRLRYRIGIGTKENASYLPWQEHIIFQHRNAVEGLQDQAGYYSSVTTKDDLFRWARQTKVAARRGTVSQIVKEIANEQGITDTVIETTLGEGCYIQSFQDDYEFIETRLLPRAINAQGRGNYRFYVQDNVVHFHTPDYQAKIKDFSYGFMPSSSLVHQDGAQQYITNGAPGVILVAYDPDSGQTAEIVSDPNKTLRFGTTTHQLHKVSGAKKNVSYHIGSNRVPEAVAISQSQYERTHQKIFESTLIVDKVPFIRPSDILRLSVIQQQKATAWSGQYLVEAVRYAVDGGTLKSALTLIRGEFVSDPPGFNAMKLIGQDIADFDNTAPGTDINVLEVTSTPLTRASGQALSTDVYSDSHDPNQAL